MRSGFTAEKDLLASQVGKQLASGHRRRPSPLFFERTKAQHVKGRFDGALDSRQTMHK